MPHATVLQRAILRCALPNSERAARAAAMVWTLADLRRFILNRHRRERWLAALAQLRARNLTNFGDLR